MNAVAMRWNDTYMELMNQARPYVMRMQSELPTDGLGRITSLVQVSAIIDANFEKTVEEMIEEPVVGAVIPVNYVDDIPTVFGIPIWERLEGEDPNAYELFKTYRSMEIEKGIKRSIYQVQQLTGVSVKELELLRQVFHWTVRTQSFDAYLETERQMQRRFRQFEIEDRHAGKARDLFDFSAKYLLEHKDLMTPKIAVQILDTAAKLERTTAGMPDGRRSPYGTDMPMVNITNQVGDKIDNTNITTGDPKQDKERLTQILNIMNTVGALEKEPEIVVDMAE